MKALATGKLPVLEHLMLEIRLGGAEFAVPLANNIDTTHRFDPPAESKN